MLLERPFPCCVVSCKVASDNAVKELSCSGILLQDNLALVPACLAVPYLTNDSAVNIDIQDRNDVQIAISVTVYVGGTTECCDADIVYIWRSCELSSAITKLFRADGLQLERYQELDNNQLDLLSVFLVLRFHLQERVTTLSAYDYITELSYGDSIALCSTPFGSAYADDFFNSVTSGVVANVLGKKNAVLHLCDIRCTPGCQGGMLYKSLSNRLVPAAVVIHSILWRYSEPSGLALAVSLHFILSQLMQDAESIWSANEVVAMERLISSTSKYISSDVYTNANLECLVRVHVNSSWGSGILISDQYVLTCAHVIQHCAITDVIVETNGQFLLCQSLPYISSHADTFDVAVLKICSPIKPPPPPITVGLASSGSFVMAYGYGILKEAERPLLTCGTVSKVVRSSFMDLYLIASCHVHSGSSGGIMVSRAGEIFGLITANTFDYTNDVIYTDVSIAVPMNILVPCISELVCSDSVSAFSALENYLVKSCRSLLKSKL